MEQLNIPTGTTVRIGRPARPIAPALVTAIANAVGTVPGVIEAHLPLCHVPSMSPAPAQVLVLVLGDHYQPEDAMRQLRPLLHPILPPGIVLDVWPLDARHTLLPAIRGADCGLQVGAPQAVRERRWWQFWR